MSQPLINYISWTRVLPQLGAAAVLILLANFLLPVRELVDAFIIGAGVYVAYSFGSRYFIAGANRRGLKAVAREEYDDALEHFKLSYEFFSKHEWLDRYRSVTLMSPSMWSYREMALMNILTVHVRRKDFAVARDACSRVLEEFPGNQIAQSTMDMLLSGGETHAAMRDGGTN